MWTSTHNNLCQTPQFLLKIINLVVCANTCYYGLHVCSSNSWFGAVIHIVVVSGSVGTGRYVGLDYIMCVKSLWWNRWSCKNRKTQQSSVTPLACTQERRTQVLGTALFSLTMPASWQGRRRLPITHLSFPSLPPLSLGRSEEISPSTHLPFPTKLSS